MTKYSFVSSALSCHFDTPKKTYQIYLKKPYQWICNAKTDKQAKVLVKSIQGLLDLPNGAQIVNNLYKNVK